MADIKRRLPSPAMLVALAALFVALGGVSYAALAKDSVKSKHIKDGAVKSAEIADGAVKGVDVKEATLDPVPRAEDAERVGGVPAGDLVRKAEMMWVEFEADGTVTAASDPEITVVDPPAYGVMRVLFPRQVSGCLTLSQTEGSDDVNDSPSASRTHPTDGEPTGIDVATEWYDGTTTEADAYKVLVLCP
ncbi:MAG TPA: hypothetical protein VIL04_00655 [Solirubrobacterales bacterium]|jgi:hypothetical protein